MSVSYHIKSKVVTCVLQWPEERTVAMLLENNTGYFSSGVDLFFFFPLFFFLSGLEFDTISDNFFEGKKTLTGFSIKTLNQPSFSFWRRFNH